MCCVHTALGASADPLCTVPPTQCCQPSRRPTLQGGDKIFPVLCDISNVADLKEKLTAAGDIDLVVNNAGIASLQPFLETDPESFDQVILATTPPSIRVRGVLLSGDLRLVRLSLEGETVADTHPRLVHLQVMAINVRGAMAVAQVAAENMKARGVGGSIVNVSSQGSMVGLVDHTSYCASKGAMDQLTRVMAVELGPLGIRTNCVNPTVVMTAMGKLGA
jgi:L-xylulose reductase